MMPPAKVTVLLQGYLERQGTEILEASSSVTLVEAAGKRLIVDTGGPDEMEELARRLKEVGLAPSKVDIVVNTHLHMDHIGGNELFPDARFYAHRLESPPAGTLVLSGGLKLLPGVEIVPSPGHTLGSVSVLASGEQRYAICGDAIPTRANLQKHMAPFIHVDERLALKSMDLLAAAADVIVPGHDALFKVERKR